MESIVKKLRGELSQAELAKRAGMAQSTIAEYELGRFPKPETLEKIASAVGKKVEWVINEISADAQEKQETTNRTRSGERRQLDRREKGKI